MTGTAPSPGPKSCASTSSEPHRQARVPAEPRHAGSCPDERAGPAVAVAPGMAGTTTGMGAAGRQPSPDWPAPPADWEFWAPADPAEPGPARPARAAGHADPDRALSRFRGVVRGLIVGALKHRLNDALHRASTTGGRATILAVACARKPYLAASGLPLGLARLARRAGRPGFAEPAQASFADFTPSARAGGDAPPAEADLAAPFGAARAQVHETYSSRRRATAWSSSTSTPRMSASSTRSSSASARRAPSNGRPFSPRRSSISILARPRR